MNFCETCGLFSRSPTNSGKKLIYLCKCHHSKPKTSKLEICSNCGLYLTTSIAMYRCKCGKNTDTDGFSIPVIRDDFPSVVTDFPSVVTNKIVKKKPKKKKPKKKPSNNKKRPVKNK